VNVPVWQRAIVAFPAAWLPWVLIGASVAAALFGAWWTWGTEAAIAFLAASWSRLLIVAAVAVVLSVFIWWAWWRLPKRQVERLRHAIRDPKARTDVEDNFRKTAGQLLGGAAVLIGAAAAYLQFTQQQQTIREQFDRQQKAAEDQLISNQVSKGFELLGNKDGQVEQRLGGIYALEGVLNNSEQYRRPVLETLCAFVRDHAKADGSSEGPPATDIQAALTVIGRRVVLLQKIPVLGLLVPPVDLRDAHLPKADLSGAKLNDADLRGADLQGASLKEASLYGADLGGADLSDTNLTFAHLRGATLTGTNLTDAQLYLSYLSYADLTGAKGLLQEQLNQACGTAAKLDPGLTIKPCGGD
jgi:hypothetical protein